MSKVSYAVACLIAVGASSSVMAQGGPPKWTVGGLGLGYLSPFEAERTNDSGDTKVDFTGVPYIAYRGERLYIEGPGLGYRLIKPTDDPVQF
ncbi:MAG: hypothetical protein AB3N28_16165 [Kordiimonas sp.]